MDDKFLKENRINSLKSLAGAATSRSEENAIANYFKKQAQADSDYENWKNEVSNIQGRQIKETPDYDLRSYFDNQKVNNPQEGTHFVDDYKTPEHMTFSQMSNQHVPVIQHGGEWKENSKVQGGWDFTPSQHNIENAGGRENLQKYFNNVESPEALNLPNDQKFTQEALPPMSMEKNVRQEALRKLSNGR